MENSSNLIKYVILGCLLCYGEGEEPCSGYRSDDRTIIRNGVSGQNMTLSCDVQSSCVRSRFMGILLWCKSCKIYEIRTVPRLSDESFSVSDVINGDMMNTSLHIDNLTESLAGIYDCSCHG